MKSIVTFLLFCIACYALIIAALYFFQDKFLFFPGPTAFGDCPEMERHDARAKTVKDIRYYLKTNPKPESWIVIFHGNAGNACDRTYFLDLLGHLNANLVVFEYPGFGKDDRKPGESLMLKQALDLVHHIKENNPEELPIYLMGESLGTGVATFVATQTDIAGLILISAYTSIANVARHHYPWAPVKYVLKHKFCADRWATQTTAPALLFHGINDDIIPIRFARRQILNFKGDKKLVEIPNCGHNDIIDVGETTIKKEIFDFISNTSF